MAQRSKARSIRARVTTGYCGATRSIVASIVSRCETTAATSERASEAASGLPSISARCRSRIASAVRCPNSASKTAARARRRPVRNARIRSEPLSASDTVDRDGDRFEPQPEHPLDGRGDRGPDMTGEWQQGVTRPGDHPDVHPDTVVGQIRRDRRARNHRAPCRSAPADPGDAGYLERSESDHLGDDAPADLQLGTPHEADSSVGAGTSLGGTSPGGTSPGTSLGGASTGGVVPTLAAGANAAPMRSGTFVRAI